MDDDIQFDSILLKNLELVLLTVTQRDDSLRADLYSHYAHLRLKRFERWGRMKDLEEAIEKGRLSIAVSTDQDQMLPNRLNNLGNMLNRRYGKTEKATDLEEAIQVTRRAVNITPSGHPFLAETLSNLANKLSRLYENTGSLQTLEEAIQQARRAVDIASKGHPNAAVILQNLVNKLRLRSAHTGKTEDLEEEILVTREILIATPESSPHLADRLAALGRAIESLYIKTRVVEGLDEMVCLYRKASRTMQDDHAGRSDIMQFLGGYLLRRYERTGNVEDIEEAVHVLSQVLVATSEDHPEFARRLSNLANAFFRRFEYIERGGDIEEAIRLERRAISLLPAECPDAVTMLNHLSRMLRFQYRFSGEIQDLEKSIQIARQVILLAPDKHPSFAQRLSDLAQALDTGYEYTGRLNDLEEAIEFMRKATCMMPVHHLDLPEMLADLGNALSRRYGRSKRREDLDEAITTARKAVEISPKDYRSFPNMLNNIGDLISKRYEQTQETEDLDEAIRAMREAISVAPRDYPNLGSIISNLSNHIFQRHQSTGDMKDLDEAIQLSREAIEAMPENHPNLATSLKNLGTKLFYRTMQLKHLKDLEEATEIMTEVWACQNATPFLRVSACSFAILLLISQNNFEKAFTLTEEVINLLPYIHKRSLSEQDQQYVVSHFSGLGPMACSLALHTGQGQDVALELLEQGRGLILRLLMDDRTSISELRTKNPGLCMEYERLLQDINRPAAEFADGRERNASSVLHTRSIRRLEECVREIQKLPGFERFHKTLTTQQIQDCASQGNIIVVNVTEVRSDAIVVTTSGLEVITLPTLSAQDAKDWICQDLTKTSSDDPNRGRKNKAYRQFLLWLWQDCVRPIIDELDYCVKSSLDDLPRVWWIGTGLASGFPFHCARNSFADPADPSNSVFHRVISTYTPTIKALQYARQRRTAMVLPADHRKTVVVTMPNTPNLEALPMSSKEAHEVTAAMSPSISTIILEHPDVNTVLQELQYCSIAHFACHGLSDPIDPSKSGLLLRTVDKDTYEPKMEMLTVQRVFQTHLPSAEIAYLSACSTAESETDRLSDETLHVVSGFQVAGFRHVIGCLWPSDDRVCMDIATSFYTKLDEKAETEPERDRKIALSFHKAVFKVCESVEHRLRPLSWVPYVHYGA